MKELILENPPKKKRSLIKRGRKTRKNPPATTWNLTGATRMASTTPAKRRKRRNYHKISTMTKKQTFAKAKALLAKRFPVRRKSNSHRSTIKRRRRRSHRKYHSYLMRGPGSPIKINGLLGGIFSAENLSVAGGAVVATIATNYALNSDMANKLPYVHTPYGRIAYNLVIPLAGGMALRKFSPNIAKGLIIGGMVNAIGQLITATKILPPGQSAVTQIAHAPDAATATPTAAYLNEYLGEYLGNSTNEPQTVGAFANSAWE